ncbi:hypothetical protein HYFRA_00008293 [Hymenoscyphus fraxineus]|uniref:Transcription elongation factor Eaf N-terminal domain-containing protein n=1 Tax=Hymenoscyphus fraxineus TaxID=746836 RepID=A0A9N9PKL9_9HELO|nr:hypothetical protein HYFRA_00008293 [Hymenoscyphus fraxineus]
MASMGFDIDAPGKYPIVLSDALLGKTTKEVYTGVRYNHKSETTPSSNSMHLDPSDNDPTNYDLSYRDGSDQYIYNGARTSSDGKYVLIFDPIKKHFVLHRVDSTFDMNLVSAPWADAADLREQYTQIDLPKSKAAPAPKKKPTKATKAAAAKAEAPKRKKAEKVTKPKPPPRAPTPDEEEEEESDDGLTVEYPDGPPSQSFQYQSTPVFRREESEASEEDSDAEGEEYEDERNHDVDPLKLPSPANNSGMRDEEPMDLDVDELEAELEQALNSGNESDESEEE